MKVILTLVSFAALTQAGVLPKPFQGRIVNGNDAQLGEIPYQVSLQTPYSSFHFCGGSILSEFYVITAAHCVIGKFPSDIKVVAATIDLKNPQSTHEVMKIVVHEKYNGMDSGRHDIALLKVKKAFHVSDVMNFVTLPNPSEEIPQDSIAVVSGWGRLWINGSSPTILQKAKIVIAAQDYCEKIYGLHNINIYDTHVCAYDPVEEIGSCQGDSGGPLTVNGKLIGLVSWAMGCASTKYPSVYTRVAEYVYWIKAHAI
ncbi:chymotrypsin-2-like [Microplitis mediator]|uniref:chymotrypsin-2-like n=1 Tax=Microplitis mediator TaxID=375433 RepID=UPI00255725BD|nr:chymotrypsin-2-like [Microplitis mediator]